MMAHRPQTPGDRNDVASGSAELESIDHGHDRREEGSRSWMSVGLSGE